MLRAESSVDVGKGVAVVVGQFSVSLDLAHNLAAIERLVRQVQRGSLVVLPEGALSGYAENPVFLESLDPAEILLGRQNLAELAVGCGVHLFYGSCLQEGGRWFNVGLYAGPAGESFVYRKVNLAMSERGAFVAGDELPVFDIHVDGRPLRVAIQLCREIRFPEQWQHLARKGAQVFIYMTNAVGDADMAPVWRSHLVSHAAVTQRFILAANNAHCAQKCPSAVFAPSGYVLREILSAEERVLECEIDLCEAADWYLSQSRNDLLEAVG